MGPFFSRLADYLADHGATVQKVNFNGGDEFFFRDRASMRYDGTPKGWSTWLAELLHRESIDCVVLFGQARPMHQTAIAVARGLGRRVFVFEEGYLRPHYVTLEPEGVNGHTSLPRDAEFYWETPYPPLSRPRDTDQRFLRMAWYATQYACATAMLRHRYPHQVHHRDLHPLKEAARWIRSGVRKVMFAVTERRLLPHLCGPAMSKKWFLLALQVHNDAQLLQHSPFDDMPEVIRKVIASFAQHAPASASLVIKHHPMDRAYRDYGREIAELVREFGVGGRVMYVHDLHLPTLLKHSRGLITVNSTTGLQAMYHGTPVCVLGDCLYAMPGLVHMHGLASFWSNPAPVEQVLYRRFRAQLIRYTQINASFYGKAPRLDMPHGRPASVPAHSFAPEIRVASRAPRTLADTARMEPSAAVADMRAATPRSIAANSRPAPLEQLTQVHSAALSAHEPALPRSAMGAGRR